MTDLISFEQCVKEETRVGKSVEGQSMGLLDASSVRHPSLAHIGVRRIIK